MLERTGAKIIEGRVVYGNKALHKRKIKPLSYKVIGRMNLIQKKSAQHKHVVTLLRETAARGLAVTEAIVDVLNRVEHITLKDKAAREYFLARHHCCPQRGGGCVIGPYGYHALAKQRAQEVSRTRILNRIKKYAKQNGYDAEDLVVRLNEGATVTALLPDTQYVQDLLNQLAKLNTEKRISLISQQDTKIQKGLLLWAMYRATKVHVKYAPNKFLSKRRRAEVNAVRVRSGGKAARRLADKYRAEQFASEPRTKRERMLDERVASHLNGNNGSYTNTDDVEDHSPQEMYIMRLLRMPHRQREGIIRQMPTADILNWLALFAEPGFMAWLRLLETRFFMAFVGIVFLMRGELRMRQEPQDTQLGSSHGEVTEGDDMEDYVEAYDDAPFSPFSLSGPQETILCVPQSIMNQPPSQGQLGSSHGEITEGDDMRPRIGGFFRRGYRRVPENDETQDTPDEVLHEHRAEAYLETLEAQLPSQTLLPHTDIRIHRVLPMPVRPIEDDPWVLPMTLAGPPPTTAPPPLAMPENIIEDADIDDVSVSAISNVTTLPGARGREIIHDDGQDIDVLAAVPPVDAAPQIANAAQNQPAVAPVPAAPVPVVLAAVPVAPLNPAAAVPIGPVAIPGGAAAPQAPAAAPGKAPFHARPLSHNVVAIQLNNPICRSFYAKTTDMYDVVHYSALKPRQRNIMDACDAIAQGSQLQAEIYYDDMAKHLNVTLLLRVIMVVLLLLVVLSVGLFATSQYVAGALIAVLYFLVGIYVLTIYNPFEYDPEQEFWIMSTIPLGTALAPGTLPGMAGMDVRSHTSHGVDVAAQPHFVVIQVASHRVVRSATWHRLWERKTVAYPTFTTEVHGSYAHYRAPGRNEPLALRENVATNVRLHMTDKAMNVATEDRLTLGFANWFVSGIVCNDSAKLPLSVRENEERHQ